MISAAPTGFRRFRELSDCSGLGRLDQEFTAFLSGESRPLHQQLLAYRNVTAPFSALEASEFILALSPLLEKFLAQLFAIETELESFNRQTLRENLVMEFRKQFVLRRARRYRPQVNETFQELDEWLSKRLDAQMKQVDLEMGIAQFAHELLNQAQQDADSLDRLTRWCVLALNHAEGQKKVAGWISFWLPERTDYAHLVPLRRIHGDPANRTQGVGTPRSRDGFKLTDTRGSLREVLGHAHYCIYCHDHDGDFCSKGFPEKKGEPDLGLSTNPLGETLTGCPLNEKISEMNFLKRQGNTVAALAVAMADNPMVPATGHRICNDCMKACIYQKQEPVDIPQIETRVLTDVLNLPWGVEIYHLLTRWNPLRRTQYLMKPYNGRKVLIAGMGPAGFTMAHHLTMEGCAVVGIDGLKIEPLPEELLTEPIAHYRDLVQSLDERLTLGFGGVAEYGITVRWDKNFLTLIYLTLARRSTVQVFGGVRLGGTITLDNAWEMGFDHVCIATGAGLPKVVNMGNALSRGMRQASDFLMALQLTGAAKQSSLANLQIRLPAVVIGGGLTGLDTATEVQAYYIAQVEKVLHRYEELTAAYAEALVRQELDAENNEILDEFLAHGRAIRKERSRAAAVSEAPNFLPLLQSWGGVTLIYRRGMNESPAYLRNHQEIISALKEGVFYAEGLDPIRAEVDTFGHVQNLVCRRRKKDDSGRWLNTAEELRIPARSVFTAAGATPNIIYENEYPGTFVLEGRHFLPHIAHDQQLQPVAVAAHDKEPDFGPLTSYIKGDYRVSFLGDTHPVFHGSVVKAMASALRSYPEVMEVISKRQDNGADVAAYEAFRRQLEHGLAPTIMSVRRDSPSVVELMIRAPFASRNFKPGQFFRIQNFESTSPMIGDTRLQTEQLALSGAGVSEDCVRFIVIETGASSRLCATFKAGDKVVVMGPTGAPTEIPKNQTIAIAGGRRGAAIMLALGPALRQAGNRILYFAGFRRQDEVYRQEELESCADVIVWCTAEGEPVQTSRPNDRTLTGDYIEIVERYAKGLLEPAGGAPPILLADVDRLLVIGTHRLLAMVCSALTQQLAGYFKKDLTAIGSVGSPMQCMLKGVCAQCLQWQIDPETGHRTRAVFSCAMQDQPLFWIDLEHLGARMQQNFLLERLTDLWLTHKLSNSNIAKV